MYSRVVISEEGCTLQWSFQNTGVVSSGHLKINFSYSVILKMFNC